MNPLIKNTLVIASPLAATLLHAAPAATFTNVNPASGSVVASPEIMLRGRISHDIYPSPLIKATLNGTPLMIDPRGNFSAKVRLKPGSNDFTLQTSAPNPRQQVTQISAYLDGSMVYGSDPARANALRTFQRGQLKTSGKNLLPLNTGGFQNANDAHIFPDAELFFMLNELIASWI